ncbi:MAG: hypothetical protein ACJ77T_10575 [Gemmatimonadaceae bacterium]
MNPRYDRRWWLLCVLAFSAALASGPNLACQSPHPISKPRPADTSGKSGAYPTGDAIGDAAAVYRVVLDQLYTFQGESPNMVVLTDRFRASDKPLPKHRTQIDSTLLSRYDSLGRIPANPDPKFQYRLPTRILTEDSLRTLERIGARIAVETRMDQNVWLGFREKFPGTWGIVGFSRVAFNLRHTQAMLYSSHQCGNSCDSGDTWVLERRGKTWRVVERIKREGSPEAWEPPLFPIRYVGLDAKPNSTHHRHAYAAFVNAITNRPTSSLTVSAFRDGKWSEVLTADSAGRVDLGSIPFLGIVGLKVGCPDQSQPDSLYVLEFLYSPGSDTTIHTPVDFRECLHPSVPHRLSGAQAFISPTEARFEFPFRASPDRGDFAVTRVNPQTVTYSWEVVWQNPSWDSGHPTILWLTAAEKSGGPPIRSLDDLIAAQPLEAMIECRHCHESLMFVDPKTDHAKVRATVEAGRIVFRVSGRDAVGRLFSTPPRAVTFSTMVRHTPAGKGESSSVYESQAVIVNCRASDSTGASRRRCDLPTPALPAPLRADSISPRRLKIVALSYDGGSLMRNLDVRIRSEDLKAPESTGSTGSAGNLSTLLVARDSLTIQALCPNGASTQRRVSGEMALYLAAGRDTTVQLLVDPRRCAPEAGRR